MPQDTAVWMYAVASPLDPRGLAEMRGVAGGPVRLVGNAGLRAVVTSVDLAEFGEAALRRNLEDHAWLEATARAHDSVIHGVSRMTATLPVPLATVYRNDDRIGALLAERYDEFAAAVRRVAGRTEWGVKAFADPSAMRQQPPPAETTDVGPGAAYLRQRRAAISAHESAETAIAERVREIHAALHRQAVDAVVYPPQQPPLAKGPGRMVLNGAYLVDDSDVETFAAGVDALAAQHPAIRLEMTGPWPPYSFAGVETGEPRR